MSPLPTQGALNASSTFFDNAVYLTQGSRLFRIGLDESIILLEDYSNMGVTNMHHNIDPGKRGILIEPDTTSNFESTILEVDSKTARAEDI